MLFSLDELPTVQTRLKLSKQAIQVVVQGQARVFLAGRLLGGERRFSDWLSCANPSRKRTQIHGGEQATMRKRTRKLPVKTPSTPHPKKISAEKQRDTKIRELEFPGLVHGLDSPIEFLAECLREEFLDRDVELFRKDHCETGVNVILQKSVSNRTEIIDWR